MTPERDPEAAKQMRVVAFGLLGGAATMLAVAVVVRWLGLRGDLDILAYVAILYALASPFAAAALRDRVAAAPPTQPAHHLERAAMLVQYGVLESATVLCAIALMVGSTLWPLLAAAVPVAAMVLNLPRDEGSRTGGSA